MNSTPRRSTGTPDARRAEASLDLPTAQQMLPLVSRIVRDIVSHRLTLTRLQPEQENLDRHYRDLVWLERNRRYAVHQQIQDAEAQLAAAVKELRALGVRLTDSATGEVEFPTKINGRPAAFTWRDGDPELTHWHYADEESRRPIPGDWRKRHPHA